MKNFFNPQCITGEESYAVSNRNILLPCCYVDNKNLVPHKAINDIIEVSNIDDHDSIDDIVNQKEWKYFYKLLVKAQEVTKPISRLYLMLPEACTKCCMGNKETVRVEKLQNLG
tara:strand:+ start:753 stop:1094 length:342 start_codon:yes stop_codon:yes gene_type:complete